MKFIEDLLYAIKDEKKPRQVYHLPPPDPIPLVDGTRKDLRIPEPLPPQKDDIHLDVYIHVSTNSLPLW